MKKIFLFLAFVLLFFLLIFETKTDLTGGVVVCFDFQEGQVSETYVKFTYEFGSQFESQAKGYPFQKEHKVQIFEGIGRIKYQDKMEKDLIIVALINGEKSPFLWVRVRDLNTAKKIKKIAKGFSDKIFAKLKEFEGLKVAEKKEERGTGYENRG